MIHLIGPGGAGKTTIGALVAELLTCPFYDLDREFERRNGNIDAYIAANRYLAYATANVDAYLRLVTRAHGVLALSSGFMTYPSNIHPQLPMVWDTITTRSTTVLLLPSFDLEECVVETVRRQQIRPLIQRRRANEDEAVIRERFPVYSGLTVQRVATMRPPMDVARDIAATMERLDPNRSARPDTVRASRPASRTSSAIQGIA